MLPGRRWPSLGRSIAPLGFGGWQIGGAHVVDGKPHGWGPVGERDAVELVQAALDRGVEFFDTAASYGGGRSEEILGKAIAASSRRGQAIVCTKIALQEGEIAAGRVDRAFAGRVEESLRRLRRDRIDVLLLHGPPDELDWRAFDREALLDLRRQGKIGAYGVSSRSLEGARRAADARFGDCVEWVFHLLERRPAEALFPSLRAAGMNFIARSPLARGLFSPHRLGGAAFAADDFRSTLPPAWIAWVRTSLHGMDLTAEEAARLPQIALQFCLRHEETSVVIPGLKTREQLDACLEAGRSGFLGESFLARLGARTAPHFPGW